MYLRNFADSSGRILLRDRQQLHRTHLVNVRKAVSEVGYYRIEREELARDEDRAGFDPESIESALSGIEGAANPVLHKIIASGVTDFSTNDWYRLYQFVSLQTTRGNRWRNQVIAAVTAGLKAAYLTSQPDARAREWLETQGRPSSSSDVEAFLRGVSERFPRVVPPKAVLVQESMRMAFGSLETDDIGLTRFLAPMQVRVIRTTVPVVTCDEPACWWAPGGGFVPYALARMVWFPLTPRLVVQFRAPDFDARAHDLPVEADALASFVNTQITSQAERWIIEHPDDAASESPGS
jgi:hypothetical protein